MYHHTLDYARYVEASARDLPAALGLLRRLTLDEFGEILMELPSPDMPALSRILPEMASAEIQETWTGSSGLTLLAQSCGFMSLVATSFTQITGRALRDVPTLDFACGWGRLLRLLLYFNDPEYIYGCDAWDVSLKHTMDRRVPGTLRQSAALPKKLPFPDGSFQLAYAFSIFTHLSQAATAACLSALRRALAPDGLLVLTVRPREIWRYFLHSDKVYDPEAMERAHDTGGFAFLPHPQIVPDGSGAVHYGDTSINLAYFQSLRGWEVVFTGRTLVDAMQVVVVLQKA